MQSKPSVERRYQAFIWDSDRWSRFTPRDGDVVVCTCYKSGTTWTQMMCALLIHQSPELPSPLAELSPWLDMRLSPIEEVIANYEAQTTRRVVKTHTPLDGLRYFDNVSYVFCARDPRDIFMSMQNHMANLDYDQAAELMRAQGLEVRERPPLPEDINDRFRLWLTVGSFEWEQDGVPFWSAFHHAETFWAYRHLSNVCFLHFSDLKSDLEGEMRRLADFLGIGVDRDAWPALVRAATFDDMKANADRTAPDTNHGLWRSNQQFFNTGKSGQWRSALSGESQALYERLTRERYDAAMLDWMERGAQSPHAPRAS